MKEANWKQLTKRRARGLAVMAFGLVVLFLPILIGESLLAVLGLLFISSGVFRLMETLHSTDETISRLSYVGCVVWILFGLVLLISPSLVLSGVFLAVMLFFLADGGMKIAGTFKQTGQERWWNLFNGLLTVALGLLVGYLASTRFGLAAIGVVLGLRLLVEGWTMFLLPQQGLEPPGAKPDTRRHPDPRLELEPSDAVKAMQDAILHAEPIVESQNIPWCLTFLGIFFAIHVLRTDAKWSFIGFISPFSATVGDAIVAVLLAVVLILPLHMFWRKITRPLERVAWKRFHQLQEKGIVPSPGERVLKLWLESRMQFAIRMRATRSSLGHAFWLLLRTGLPLTAIFIAINSIWGFSWYFNSENWASAVWQEITKVRVDAWRTQMAEDVEKDAVARGIAPEKIFTIEPEGVNATDDFSFVVIGDTGEGDPSQMSLRDQLIAANNREKVKFLVLSSDVIYPDGKMKDYETNFYLPFKGFEKPIYAIPGNHDWFDADEGFNANFLERSAALIALRARLAADLKTDAISIGNRFTEITGEAQRLRELYRIKNGLQRGPYFEMHTPGFSLATVDTGIMRRIDLKQKEWLVAALQRAGSNFKMVVLGHPFYVEGADQGANDPDFDEIHKTLQRFNVNVAMAGDTHDFEFYREMDPSNGKRTDMLHFVNGGGGAYLSIGTALAFPNNPVTADYAFYPRTDELDAKIRNETPFWKAPFLIWMDWFHCYPATYETLAGAFDFNRAPFFQSFMEIRVERSHNRVRFLLYGVNGQLRWRDIQTGGSVKPADQTEDDFVEFTAPLS